MVAAEGGWSIAQVVEHLLVTDGLYQDRIRDAIKRGAERQAAARDDRGDRPCRESFCTASSSPTTRAGRGPPAPSRPLRDRAQASCPRISHSWTNSSNLLHEAEGLDLTRLRFGSPALALFRLNLGDAFRLTVSTCGAARSPDGAGARPRAVSAVPGVRRDRDRAASLWRGGRVHGQDKATLTRFHPDHISPVFSADPE